MLCKNNSGRHRCIQFYLFWAFPFLMASTSVLNFIRCPASGRCHCFLLVWVNSWKNVSREREWLVKNIVSCHNYHLENNASTQIKRGVLCCLNYFLRVTKQISLGFGICLDFSKRTVGTLLTEFFAEHGSIGMLKALDYESIVQVSTFLGAITESMCPNECILEEILLFAIYILNYWDLLDAKIPHRTETKLIL